MASAPIITIDEVRKVLPDASPIVQQAEALEIDTPEDYEVACSFLTLVTNRENFVLDKINPVVETTHKAWKAACGLRSEATDPYALAKRIAKGKIAAYDEKMERERRVREQRDAEALRQKQQEDALAEAARLEASGEKELADLVLENAANAPAPVVVIPSIVPKQDGIAKITSWKWRYQGGDPGRTLRALVKAAATDERWLAYLSVNEVAVGATGRTQKDLAKVPGIEFYPERSVSVRSR